MDPRGRRILVFGDSLTHRGARTAPDGVPALPLANRTGTPGDLLASYLLAAGAAAVRINGRVSRSAVNLWKGNNGENGAAVVAAEASARPDLVIIMLGTNDLGMGATADAAAFQRLRDAFASYGAEVAAIGPPAFARADLNAKAVTVYQTLARVFGTNNVIDARPLSADVVTTAQGRAGDGIHFAGSGASKVAARLAQAVLTRPGRVAASGSGDAGVGPPVVVDAGTLTPPSPWWSLLGAAAAVVAIGGAVLVKRRRRGLGAVTVDADEVPAKYRDEVIAAAARAERAGADGPLEFVGIGMEGVVFCDDAGRAYKVGRRLVTGAPPQLATEAAFLKKAGQIPAIKQHVAKFYRYDAASDVIVRECVRPKGTRRGGRNMPSDDAAWDMGDRIDKVMRPYGFTGPERKRDSFVYVSGRGLVLVDAGFALKRGHELVKEALDVANARRVVPRAKAQDLVWALEAERDGSVPAKVADPLIARLRAQTPGLDGTPSTLDERWVRGGCLTFARALKRRLGRSAKLVDIVEPETSGLWAYPGLPHHVMVAYRGQLWDATGAHTPDSVVAAWTQRRGTAVKVEPHHPQRARELLRDRPMWQRAANAAVDQLVAQHSLDGVTKVISQPWLDVDDDMEVAEWRVTDEADIDGVELRNNMDPTKTVLAHRSTKQRGWQATWFDDRGPASDVIRPTLVAALEDQAPASAYDVVAVHLRSQRGLRGDGNAVVRQPLAERPAVRHALVQLEQLGWELQVADLDLVTKRARLVAKRFDGRLVTLDVQNGQTIVVRETEEHGTKLVGRRGDRMPVPTVTMRLLGRDRVPGGPQAGLRFLADYLDDNRLYAAPQLGPKAARTAISAILGEAHRDAAIIEDQQRQVRDQRLLTES